MTAALRNLTGIRFSLFVIDADGAAAFLAESSLERFTLAVSAEKAAAATPQGLLL
jgi:hypothetical protein